jgi:hypothetical protein
MQTQKKRAAKKRLEPSVSPAIPFPAGAPQPSSRQLLRCFVRLLPRRALWKLPALQDQSFYERLFTPLVTLWYLIFQRLQSDHTLEKVVADAKSGGADSLRKDLSQDLLSTATTSFSNARQRLPLAFLTGALTLQARRILRLNPQALWRGLQVGLLDGSTVRLRPHGDIPKEFPPHRNQAKAPAYWCLLRVVAGFCAHTGTALDCALGSLGFSEQVLACQIILREAAAARLWIGDRNFGVFRIVQTARAAGAQVLLRLTRSRARKLLGRPPTFGRHRVNWSPTRHDQLQPDCARDPVAGQLLVVRIKRKGFRAQTLYLFTTLPESVDYPLAEIVELYGWRWHIELNLRYLKTQMRLMQLECQSAAMAQKEWVAGLLAYNLIRAAMLCAALRHGLSPLILSFSQSRRHLENWLRLFGQDGGTSTKQWGNLLLLISRARLPRRRKSRPAEPRAQRHLRQPYPPLVGDRAKARRLLKNLNQKS